RRARGEAGVVERGAGGGADLGERGAARALAALDQVAGDGDVVGRARPRQVDLRGRERGGQEGRGGRGGRRVRRGAGDGGGRAGERPHVVGGVGGAHAEAVARAGGEPGAVERGAGGGADLGERGAARALAALDEVVGDADVVGGRGPRQVDL